MHSYSTTRHTRSTCSGTVTKPLFRANDIGNVLDIANIRMSINTYDDDEKVVRETDTLGGSQAVTFLIKMYRLLMRSNKPIAKPFQKWVSQVVSIRERGKYELELQVKEHKEHLMRAEQVADTRIHEATISTYDSDEVVLRKTEDQRTRAQETTFLTESGVYHLLMRSNTFAKSSRASSQPSPSLPAHRPSLCAHRPRALPLRPSHTVVRVHRSLRSRDASSPPRARGESGFHSYPICALKNTNAFRVFRLKRGTMFL